MRANWSIQMVLKLEMSDFAWLLELGCSQVVQENRKLLGFGSSRQHSMECCSLRGMDCMARLACFDSLPAWRMDHMEFVLQVQLHLLATVSGVSEGCALKNPAVLTP